jgi:DNA-binding GntR family transcriptional regulator
MAAIYGGFEIAPEKLRLMLLAFGMEHAFRVIGLQEITQTLAHIKREMIRKGLDQLAQEGLVTRFAGRYCFNKPISAELREAIERVITPSGTMRVKARVKK